MKITFTNYDTKKEISFETEKKLIMIYGKNGVGKTTLSRIDSFEKKYVFNEDFIYSNVFNISEKGVTQSPTTKENFSGLWIGENIVKVRKEITSIIQKEKFVLDKISEIEKINIDFFSKQGIPFNLSEKLKLLFNKDFKLTDEDIETQRNNYMATKSFPTTIKEKQEYRDNINYLKRNDLYKQLIGNIQKSPLLCQKVLRQENNYIEELNIIINNLEKHKELINRIEQVFKEDDINEELKEKIREWYSIHVEKDHCIFCGNKDIGKSLEKWKEVFANIYIEQKKKIKVEIENNIKICEEIINIKQYEQIDKEVVEYIINVKDTLEVIKSNIESNNYESLEITEISKDIKIVELSKLMENIINYTLNHFIIDLEFYYNAGSILKTKREKMTKELDKMMDNEGDKIASEINNTLKDLGLNKNINISVDRRSKPYKFTYNIENHKEIGELSDGQKHKLALSIFINSIINDDLTDKTLVIDDPVVALDISSYILFKQLLITKLITKHFTDTTKLLLLTHDITYLYIQLSNIFNDPEMKNDTVIYKLSDSNIKEIPIDYIKTDDISLFKMAVEKCSNVTELKCLNRITIKIFRIIIDIRLRFYGISDTSEVGVQLLPINSSDKDILQKYSNHLSTVAREKNPKLKDILEGIKYIKNTADLFGMVDFITNDNIEEIEKIIKENKEEKIEDDLFVMIDSIGRFLNTTKNKTMKGYVEHTRVSYTRNMIGLSLEDFFE